jgi:endonuclease/exonuclease/phosphatase (EEP) superfamily protein YafD
MNIALTILASIVLVATLLPIIRLQVWWIRVFDFPRVQIILAAVVVLAGALVLGEDRSILLNVLATGIVLALGYHVYRVLPFSVLWRRQVPSSSDSRPADELSVFVANVLMENRDAGKLLALIRERDPDVILAVETDDWWVNQFRAFETSHPHVRYVPQPNTYGLVFMSRFPVEDLSIERLVEEDVPSVHATLVLQSGVRVCFHGLHPRPPHPTYGPTTTPRDAELLIVGRRVAERTLPTIVAGDLNDVAWSHTTRLFQRISGLLDPRRGRGMFNTFHAEVWVARWPLDHVFHSSEFQLQTIERLPAFGSDHFPVLARLVHAPGGTPPEHVPTADSADRLEAREKINDALAADPETT